jgi:hypothetical protein
VSQNKIDSQQLPPLSNCRIPRKMPNSNRGVCENANLTKLKIFEPRNAHHPNLGVIAIVLQNLTLGSAKGSLGTNFKRFFLLQQRHEELADGFLFTHFE